MAKKEIKTTKTTTKKENQNQIKNKNGDKMKETAKIEDLYHNEYIEDWKTVKKLLNDLEDKEIVKENEFIEKIIKNDIETVKNINIKKDKLQLYTEDSKPIFLTIGDKKIKTLIGLTLLKLKKENEQKYNEIIKKLENKKLIIYPYKKERRLFFMIRDKPLSENIKYNSKEIEKIVSDKRIFIFNYDTFKTINRDIKRILTNLTREPKQKKKDKKERIKQIVEFEL